jgi:hypothetical protein
VVISGSRMRLKRGPESSVLAQDLYRGELALATDTQTIFASDGSQKFPVGKAIVDSYDHITTYSGMDGRFFYAFDSGLLYVNYLENWELVSALPTGVSGTGGISSSFEGDTWIIDGSTLATKQQLTTTSGNIVSKIPSLTGYATQSWTNANFIDNAELAQNTASISGSMVDLLTSMSGTITIQATKSPYYIQVGPELPVTSIQAGIDLCDTSEGVYYIVQLYPGRYEEDIILKDYVDIVGINYNCVIVGTVTWPADRCSAGLWSSIHNIGMEAYPTASGEHRFITSEAGEHDIVNCWIFMQVDNDGPEVRFLHIAGGNVHGYIPEWEFLSTNTGVSGSLQCGICVIDGTYTEIAGDFLANIDSSDGNFIAYHVMENMPGNSLNKIGGRLQINCNAPYFNGEIHGFQTVCGGESLKTQGVSVDITAISGGLGHGFYVDSSETGAPDVVALSHGNRIRVQGFDFNYSGRCVEPTDLLVSHFDSMHAENGFLGSPSSIKFVNSPAYGELNLNEHMTFTIPLVGVVDRDLIFVDIGQINNPRVAYYSSYADWPRLMWDNPEGPAAFMVRSRSEGSSVGALAGGPTAHEQMARMGVGQDNGDPDGGQRKYRWQINPDPSNLSLNRFWTAQSGEGWVPLVTIDKEGMTQFRYGVLVDRFLNESDMISYSPTALPTQKSVVDYIDTISGAVTTDLTEYVNAYVKPYRYLSVSISGGDFHCIQDAIDSINITDFDSEYWAVQVHPGVYYEDVYLKDNVDLIGDSYDACIIDGSVNWLSSHGCNAGYWSAIQNITVQANTTASGFCTVCCDAGNHDIVNAYVWLTTEGVGGNCILMEGGNIVSYLTMYEYDHTGDTSSDPEDNHRCVRGLGGSYESQSDKYVIYVEDTAPDRVVTVITQRSLNEEDRTVVVAANVDVTVASGFQGKVEGFRIRGGSTVNSVNAAKVHIESLGGGTAYGYYVDSLEVGAVQSRVYSTANRITLLGFDTDYFAHVGSQDYFGSHFDDIICKNGVEGNIVNYQMVSSEVDGQLRVTDHIKLGRGIIQDQKLFEVDTGQGINNPHITFGSDYFGYIMQAFASASGSIANVTHSPEGPVLMGSMSYGPNPFPYEQRLSVWAHKTDDGSPLGYERRGYRLKRKTDESFAISRHWTYEDGGAFIDLLNIDPWGGLRLRNSDVRVSAILDEDNMVSNTASGIPTQQSVKAYVDNTEQMIHNWVDLQNYTVSGTIPLNLYGNSTFGVSGTSIIHNLNNIEHFTGVTPTVTNISDATKVGVIYVSRDINTDTVYTTGGPDSVGLPFMWQVTGMSIAEPPPLSPLGVFNCRLWLVSDRGITLDAGEVSYWEDQSGFGHHLGNTFQYYRPTLAMNYVSGHPALQFSDGYQPLFWQGYGNDRGWGTGIEEWECYIVMKDTGTFSYGRFIYAPFINISSYNGYPTVEFANGNLVSSHIATSWSIVRFRWNATSAWISVNNSAEETISGRAAKSRTIWESLDFDSQMLGYVPEIIAFPRFLDGEESAYILNYLHLRYNITIN